jgi:nicotinate-nucleotide--dimethylbenzimidazole phosphoribosyltransferase
MSISSVAALHALCRDLPAGDDAAAGAVAVRQATLTKPPGSLGRLERLVAWLSRWQRRPMPRLDRVAVLVFAGNHGVTARGVSPYSPEVTAQMVANFAAGGAAINQLATLAGAELRVVPLELDWPTEDITVAPAMDEAGFLAAVSAGFDAVEPGTDLLCLGEMGIGNTTAAAALAAGLLGGGGADWAGRGTGVDDAGLARKVAAVDAALARHAAPHPPVACATGPSLSRSAGEGQRRMQQVGESASFPLSRTAGEGWGEGDALALAASIGGRELAAILGAVLAARHRGVPVLLDGFVCTAAAAPLALLAPGGLDHCAAAHVSAEAGHRRLLAELRLEPLLDLGMRLGEASGAALAVLVARAALACHAGMASFAASGVSNRQG